MEEKQLQAISSLNYLDFSNFDTAVLAVIIISTLIALYRGFTKSILSIAGWIFSVIISWKIRHLLSPFLIQHLSNEHIAGISSFFIIFSILSIVIMILNNIIASAMSAFCGGLLDRSLGMFFGFIRGCFIVSFAFYIMTHFITSLAYKDETIEEYHKNLPKWAKSSKSMVLLSRGANIISGLIPENFEEKLSFFSEDKGKADKKKEITKHQIKERNHKENMDLLLSSLPVSVLEELSQQGILLLKDKNADSDDRLIILNFVKEKCVDYPSDFYHDSSGKYQNRNKVIMMIDNEMKENLAVAEKQNETNDSTNQDDEA